MGWLFDTETQYIEYQPKPKKAYLPASFEQNWIGMSFNGVTHKNAALFLIWREKCPQKDNSTQLN